jgi:5-methylcytosine-specific restriction endonuclease McrA
MNRRRFNKRERVALYLAADGQCTKCGSELELGFHGDHVQAYAKDGVTDVINGQALCRDCNLKKGTKDV